MTEQAFTLFDTAIGACGVAWNECGLIGVQLPEADAAAGRARMEFLEEVAMEIYFLAAGFGADAPFSNSFCIFPPWRMNLRV